MDEFKPEDELKPDASDRRPSRPRKTASAPKVPVSRQHMMMGIGILVLLLLVLGIGSALKGPDESKPAAGNGAKNAPASSGGNGGEKSIDLSGSTTMSGGQTAPTEGAAPGNAPVDGSAPASGSAPRDVSMPPVSSTPTQAAPVEAPASQQRVTLPGDLNSALSNQQQQVDNAAQGGSSLPTAPATVSGSAGNSISAPAATRSATPRPAAQPHASREPAHKSAAASRPAASESRTHTTPARPALGSTTSGNGAASSSSATASSSAAGKSVPGGNYTLQLSGASRAESLNAWAKKQNLSGYHVYKTTRNGQPWYVLVSGSYATSADARRAVASLPAEVRAQNPWVKPVSQVKKEASQ
ncbi:MULTISPECIES: SPOR domain-containing protein [Pantoea]|jgi:DamX protein|nr:MULTISPECIES: SPOR domain-containing protein [Pantoea]MBZ6384671.1 SPOR domain-containing protein [Pantoea piersonii]MBZ6401645.1 SPOR domain-containing protein [Pantoea piersonii]MBZ6407290.1 SPOR domain-containing protein [Pantoea piersonii]MBZ6426613.1 SPOR domain-containing protein [Pantoea piersonii]NYB03506.1 SPOR domain-containing protein [Pantoea piersonii]